MTYTKEEYEKKINESKLFEIDFEKDAVLYKTERTAFFDLIAKYYKSYIFKGRDIDGYVFIETANECVKYYKPEKGKFLNFFGDVLKRNLRVAQGKERQMQLRGGIRISRKNDKYMRAIVRYIEKYEGELRREALYEKIAKLIGKSAEEVQRLIAMNNSAVCVEETYVNDEGETESIFDNMSDSEEITEDKLIQTEKFHKLIEELNEMFLTVQDRSRRLLSMLITSKIISEFDDDYEKILPIIRKKSFFNAELFERYLQDGKVLTARQIASLCGVTVECQSYIKEFFTKEG